MVSVWSASLCAAPAVGGPQQELTPHPEGVRDVVTLSFSHLMALAMRLACVPLRVCFTCHKRFCLVAAVSPKSSILCELRGLERPGLVEGVSAHGRGLGLGDL